MFSAWEMNVSLADELKALRSRLGTEAADERARIIALLQGEGETDAEYWYNKGKENERAKIIAWLRAQNGYGYDYVRGKCIEAGDHLK